MNVLVAYASKYGATREIAERLADRMRAAGIEAQAQPVTAVRDLSGYNGFVIGGAAYLGHWLNDATAFVRRTGAVLASQPTWLFSSGPLGTRPTDAEGRDLRLAAEPKEFAEFNETIKPIGTRVFFGALDPGKLGFRDRAVRALPAGRRAVARRRCSRLGGHRCLGSRHRGGAHSSAGWRTNPNITLEEAVMHATEAAAIRSAAVERNAGTHSATRIVVSTFGALVAFAGMEHGIGRSSRDPSHQPDWPSRRGRTHGLRESWAGNRP